MDDSHSSCSHTDPDPEPDPASFALDTFANIAGRGVGYLIQF
jgi:hypothetical protein